ncbi:Phosphoserine phosphatase [Candidatus Rhodobacter oscarellae]|uniref:Phosphoserine phosphatase n=1 Tax=Candidatus Rhodobacter oscarellae TaxID=1675527 RepID=A0A0J9E860_9RHOB|nr:phosphoserine phosphatase SerB [Candidatus Rhodobacter lobularis]KMW58925.1 Phosphoserine phosphatase [Candidatus Rhodobacter lobularis]
MFVITLIADPQRRNLDPALPTSLRNAWGGGDVTWLSPDEAAEFPVERLPGNFWTAWEDCRELGVDMVPVPAENRRKRLLLADMDSTLIQQECIDELAAEAGFGEQVSAITARAMNGELDFEQAIDERVGLLAGLPVDVITKVLAERITYMPGGKTLVATMKASGAYCALVSGGFTEFTGPVATHLGMDEHRANVLLRDGAVLSGAVQHPILGRAAKVEALDQISAKQGITVQDAIAVGDGANDLGMLGRAGMGVALHAKPAVAAQCDIRINYGDLTALLYLQGYNRDEFS